MKRGLVSVTFRALNPDEILELARRAGLETIEWGGDVHVPPGALVEARRVGQRTLDTGLAVAAYGSYCRLTDDERLSSGFERVVETAQALGAPLIRVWAGTRGSAETSLAEFDRIAENASAFASLAQSAGMDTAFEFHGGTLTDDAGSALRLLQTANHPRLGTLWQPPVDMSTEACLSSIQTVSQYIRNIHVFSWRGTERLPLTEGEEKWKTLLPRIQALPGERSLLIEFVKGDEPEQLIEDAKCLKRWMEEADE